jgi:hypothetical protein
VTESLGLAKDVAKAGAETATTAGDMVKKLE